MIGFYNYTVYATYISLISSVVGIIMAFTGHPTIAMGCLLGSGLCDMFDGRIARTRERTHAEKQFGIQIDSLSDLVCFGVLPAVIGLSVGMTKWYFYPVIALYVLCGLIRLAYFNVTEEERQSKTDEVRRYFEGLPITSAALIFPVIYVLHFVMSNHAHFAIVYAAVLFTVAILFVSPFKLRKPGMRTLMVFLALGAVELLAIIYMVCR